MQLDNEQLSEILEEKKMLLGKSGIKSSNLYLAEDGRPAFKTRLIRNEFNLTEVVEIQINNDNDFTINGEKVERDVLTLMINQTSFYYESSIQKGLVNYARSAITLTQLLLEYDEDNASEDETNELSELLHNCDRTKQIIKRHSFLNHIRSELIHELEIIDTTGVMSADYKDQSNSEFVKTLDNLVSDS